MPGETPGGQRVMPGAREPAAMPIVKAANENQITNRIRYLSAKAEANLPEAADPGKKVAAATRIMATSQQDKSTGCDPK